MYETNSVDTAVKILPDNFLLDLVCYAPCETKLIKKTPAIDG